MTTHFFRLSMCLGQGINMLLYDVRSYVRYIDKNRANDLINEDIAFSIQLSILYNEEHTNAHILVLKLAVPRPLDDLLIYEW